MPPWSPTAARLAAGRCPNRLHSAQAHQAAARGLSPHFARSPNRYQTKDAACGCRHPQQLLQRAGSLDSLPPCRAALTDTALDTAVLGLAPSDRSDSGGVSEEGLSDTELELLVSNNTGMQLSFLGTCLVEDGRIRSSNSVALRLGASIWLIDCGEDTQRQLQRQPHLRAGKIDRIFVTSLAPHNILGLPGMLCSLSSARVKGQENADVPLHIYGPPGLVEFIRVMLMVSDTYLEMPILIHELVPHAVDPQYMEPELVHKRARLWAVQVPPDQLNPNGYYDGDLRAFLSRHKGRKRNARDPRSSYRPLPLPPPGDPDANMAGDALMWTIKCGNEYLASLRPLPAPRPTLGLLLEEAASSGRLDPVAAAAKGVPGNLRAMLKEGHNVTLRDGTVVHPAEVVGPDRPGRKLVILGDTTDASPVATCANDVELVVHGVASPDGDSSEATAMQLAAAAGRFAAAVGAETLVLTRCPPTNSHANPEAVPAQLARAAAHTFGKPGVLVAEDLLLISVQRREVSVQATEGDN